MVKRLNSSVNSASYKNSTQRSHRVRSGENLSRIAKNNGLTLAALLQANPQIKNPDHIRVGQQIYLPQQAPTATSAGDSQKADKNQHKTGAQAQHSHLESGSEQRARQKQQHRLAQKKAAPPQVKTGGLPQKNGALSLLQSKKELLQGLKTEAAAQGSARPKARSALAPVNTRLVSQLGALGPKSMQGVEPMQLLGAVKDGDLKVRIPLKAGRYKISGINVDIPKGSVLKLQAQVRNGKLVPAEDRHGQQTGGGCKVEIDPPLDLPLWVDGKGAYLKDKGQAQAQFNADLGGWFDQSIGDNFSTDLKTLVKGLGDGRATPQAGGTSSNAKNATLPRGLLKLEDMKFDVGQVRMKTGHIDLGSARLDLAPGNNFSIHGDAQGSELRGQVKLRGMSLRQDGSTMRMGASSARLSVKMHKGRDGKLHTKTSLSQIRGELQGFDKRVEHTDGRIDHIALGKTQISGGRFDIESSIKNGKDGVPQVAGFSMRGQLKGKGLIESMRLDLPDDKGGAQLRLGAGTFSGQLAFGPAGSKVDIEIKNNTLNINDLQSNKQGARLDLTQAKIQGSGTISFDAAQHKFQLDLDAKDLDLQLKDYRGATKETLVDLGQSSVHGRGKISFGNKTGLQVDGDMQIKSAIDDLKIDKPGGPAVDLAGGSKIDANLSHLALGGGRSFELDTKGAVDLGLENFKTKMPGLKAQGQARLSGAGNLHIGDGQMFLTEADATVRVRVDDAKIAGGKDFALDVAAGSNMDLKVKEFKRSTISSDNSIKLGRGSQLDAVLDSGQLRVGDDTIKLQAGSRAQFKLDGLEQGDGQPPALRGSLSIDAKISPDLAQRIKRADALKIDDIKGSNGRVKIAIDDVSMQQNGKFELRGVDLRLDAKADRISASVPTLTGDDKGRIEHSQQQPLKPLRPVAAAAIQSPDGTLSQNDVQKMSAASIAGANMVGHNFNPAKALKGLKNGTLKLSVPVEGKLGKGWIGSAEFPKGSTLELQFKVKDGKIVPDKTKAKFSKAGDGALWVTVKGAYFDKDNSLRMDLGGMYDFVVPGMEKMPLDIGQAVDRLLPDQGQSATGSDAAAQLKAFKFHQARISVSKAEFKAGPLDLPGGQVVLKEGNRLSVSGSGADLKINGQVNFSSLQMASDGVALKSKAGSAKIKLRYQNKNGQGTLSSSLSDVNLDLQYAVHRRDNGDYIHLAGGHVVGASFSSNSKLQLDANGLPKTVSDIQVNLDIPKFDGQVNGARVTVDDADGEAQIELGRSQVQGEIHVVNNKINMRGHFSNLDAAVSDLAMGQTDKEPKASVDISSARLHGQGDISYSQGQGINLDADIKDSELRLRDAKVDGQGLQLDVGQTRLAGQGHIHLNSQGDIDVTGKLRLDSTLDPSTIQGSPLGVKGDLKLAQDSRLSADIRTFHMGADGSFRLSGEGGVDLEVEGFQGDLPGLKAEGHATIRGGGAFSIDSKTGMKFPDRFSIGVDLNNAQIASPDGRVQLDLAQGAHLQAEVNKAEIAGKDSEIVLGHGSRLSGALDGGSISIPGLEQRVQIKPGSRVDLHIENLDAVGQQIREADGQLYLDAIIDQDQIDISQIKALKGFSFEKIEGGQLRLKVNVGRARLNRNGQLQLLDSSLSMGATVNKISGQYQAQ